MMRGQLSVLAELGVMPNPVLQPLIDKFSSISEISDAGKKIKGSPRSDVTMPLAAWRGSDGIDEDRLKKMFGDILS